MTSPRPEHQFYGRRKGKPLRRHHVDLMQNLLPQLAIDMQDPLAGTQVRRWLEIGFGGGEHLAHQAEINAGVTLIGVEAYMNGVAKLLAHVEEKAISNVRVHYGDARVLLQHLPDQSFERIYLLYPDPWPKERQKKRRIVSESILLHFHRILIPAGKFLFASDISDYVQWTKHEVAQNAGFSAPNAESEPFENWVSTRFEIKAQREGRSSAYLTFVKK